MPPSQLKTLKKSLREQGIVGPQKSKKQKKQSAQNGLKEENRVGRTEKLAIIRDQGKAFDYKWSKGPKRHVTTLKDAGTTGGHIIGRPLAKQSRIAESDVTMHMKNKVGGIIDRRFGENDPSMDPEQRMMERFVQETQRRVKNTAFDLEDDDDTPISLTNMGHSLSVNGPAKDDFEEDISGDDLSDAGDHQNDSLKRRRILEDGDLEEEEVEEEDRPERKKSKQEVMKEVIAKSKLYKYERQAAKEDDDELRERLDKELPDIQNLLQGLGRPKPGPTPKPALDLAGNPAMNPDRLALLRETDVDLAKEYDMAHRQMALDKRSVPSERIKSDEEIAKETAQKLKELEAIRIRRMEGAESSDEEGPVKTVDEEDEEDDFGFGAGIPSRAAMTERGVEDEDDFVLDDDLLANDSDIEANSSEANENGDDNDDEDDEVIQGLLAGTKSRRTDNFNEEDDPEFTKGILTEEESRNPKFLTGASDHTMDVEPAGKNGENGNLPYTFNCPQSHDELVEITFEILALDLPKVVQRIRLQYDSRLAAENKTKLGKFAVALVDHISYLANQPNSPPMSVLESLIRHIHSMAKTLFPIEIAKAFRSHLEQINESRALTINAGDLVLLTAIGTIFPTSDHFHQVITSATLTMTRYLGLKKPQNLSDITTGAFLATQLIQYQRLSKRYVPEVMSFIENTLCILAPSRMPNIPGHFPSHEPKVSVRITDPSASSRKIKFSDCQPQELSTKETESLKVALLEANLKLIDAALDIWVGKPSTFEIFEPVLRIAEHFGGKRCRSKIPQTILTAITKLSQKLNIQLKNAELARRPLELHHHKPLAIKSSNPKFEESFNPNKHYDPDRERTESAKLKKEFKRERKGAIRELRRDAKVLARESLKEKKEKDAAYEKKYKRLVAEIQGEEGREGKAYEREREWRKKSKK